MDVVAQSPTKERKPNILPVWKTRREKRTFRVDGKKAWNSYWETVWRNGKIKIRNPNDRTRAKYPKISVGYLIHQDPATRRRILDDYAKWRELHVDGLPIARYPNALHKGTHVHLEAQKLNPEVAGLHKGDRYYGIIEDVREGEFEVQLYDVRSGKPLRKITVPLSKLGEYEARYHPTQGHKRKMGAQASDVARTWLLNRVRA